MRERDTERDNNKSVAQYYGASRERMGNVAYVCESTATVSQTATQCAKSHTKFVEFVTCANYLHSTAFLV